MLNKINEMSEDSSDDENVIRYGTPLEQYEEDEIPLKKRSQHGATSQQYAVDAQGQRRFHGAFTGGFQAGHGNTVAAPEGWVPSQFKSSRREKGFFANQRPEDFMDEEDRGEFGIAPNIVQFNKDFSSNKRPHSKHDFNDGIIPGEPVLRELMSMVHESAAVRMLRGMGWKPGQGVGERQSAADKRQTRRAVRKDYGCHVPAEYRQPASTEDREYSSDKYSDEELDYDTLFAPDDFQLLVQKTKNNTFGLGYQGLSRRSVLSSLSGHYGKDVASSSHLVLRDKGKKVSIRGQAFGVGALEEDDEDIYAREDMSNYDFVLESRRSEPKPDKTSNKSAGVLEGFIPASVPQPSVSHHPPPALPRDYTPKAGVKKSRFQSDTTTQTRERNLAKHELTATQRGAMLGEETNDTINKPSETIPADIITPITDRILNSTSKIETQPKPSIENELKQKPEQNEIEKKTVDPNMFRPFASNPEKQARYEKFLEVKEVNMLKNTEKYSERDPLMEWERVREKCEFEQAAKLYRPLTGILSDRFTRPCHTDDASINPFIPVTLSKTHAAATEQQVEAACIGMFGKLTRTIQDWRPDALLCKRFNVPEPYSSTLAEMSIQKKKTSYSIFDYLDSSVHNKECFAEEQSQFSGSKSLIRIINTNNLTVEKSGHVNVKDDGDLFKDIVRKDLAVVNRRLTVTDLFLLEKKKEHKKTFENSNASSPGPYVESNQEVDETIDKFDKIDLYKAIFLSDSDSDTDTHKDMSISKNFNEISSSPALLNVERNPSPPRGIFANIDFDEINSWQKRSTESSNVNKQPTLSQSNLKTSEVNNKSDVRSVELTDIMTYGPKLPDKPIFNVDKFDKNVTIDLKTPSLDSESWFDASDKKKKSKKKKKCKDKLRKHKHKSKRNKHKCRI